MKADVGELKTLPELNLYNFEEDEFVGSKYVLTSPRSLEACDMLNVKPLQLIYKPLSDFQDEMRQRGLTFQDAYNEYDRYEKERQQKLRECRDYRDKMIRDNIFKSSEEVLPAYERGEAVTADRYLGARKTRSGGRGDSSSSGTKRHAATNGSAIDQPVLTNGTKHSPSVLSNGTRHGQSALTNGYTARHSDMAGAEANGEVWRTHPPYSERHLSKHTTTKSGSTQVHSNGVADRQTGSGFKSRFMREKLGVESDEVKQQAASLPLHRGEPYKSAYNYHRRSYTTDGVTPGLNRTSTPCEGTIASRPKAEDRSFSTISDIYSANSPRDEYTVDTAPVQRRRTTSAYANLERETSALRGLATRYEGCGDLNMSRSLSLTDLTQPIGGVRQRPLHHRAGRHQRGYTSDEEHTSAYRHRTRDSAMAARAEDILSRALDRRQREIEADLRQEQLEYRQQVNALRQDLTDMRIDDCRFNTEVAALDHELGSRRWRHYREAPARHLSMHDRDTTHLSPHVTHPGRSLPHSQWYEGETLADRTQRERRTELARLQAVEELETARVLSRKSRLQSERVRRAFHEALSKNVQKWDREQAGRHETNNNEDNYDSYKHIEEVLSRSLSSDQSLNSSRERAYPRPTRATGSPLVRREAKVTNGYEEREYDRLRDSLKRNETYLTEEAVRKHTLMSSLSPREEDDEYTDVEAELEETEERLRSLINSPRYTDEMEDVALVANGISNGHSDVRRDRKSAAIDRRRERVRLKHEDQALVEERVREMRAALEDRRKKLTDKLKMTDRQTQELRAARLESERKERELKQERASRRILKSSSDNSKKKQSTRSSAKAQSAGTQRISEQVRPSKVAAATRTPPRQRDTFDKKVLKAELNNWVNTGHRSQRSRSRSANRNRSQFTLT